MVTFSRIRFKHSSKRTMIFNKLLLFFVFLVATGAQGQECKTVDTVENFDVVQYASAPWYIHQQAETRYSPLDRNYCTRAQYSLRDSPSFWGYTVSVNNYAEDAFGNDYGGPLCAFQDEDSPGKLAVAPCLFPKFVAGPYWIVAYNESEGYALVSGGQPTIPGKDSGCQTGTDTNNAGLWIFMRSQERNEGAIEKVRSIAEDAGFDVSVLNDVVQEGCAYDEEDNQVDNCKDQAGNFRVWFANRDCDWVDKSRTFRCAFHGDRCPDTCGKC